METFSVAPPSYFESQKESRGSNPGTIYTYTAFFHDKGINISCLWNHHPDESVYLYFRDPPLGSFLTPALNGEQSTPFTLPNTNVVSISYESTDCETLVSLRDSMYFKHFKESALQLYGSQNICKSMVKYFTKDENTGNIHFQITVEKLKEAVYRHFLYLESYFTTSSIYSMVVKYSKGSIMYEKGNRPPKNSILFTAPPLSISVFRESEALEHVKISHPNEDATFAVVYKSATISALEVLKSFLVNFKALVEEPLELKDIMELSVEIDPVDGSLADPFDATEIHLDVERLIYYWHIILAFNCNVILPSCDEHVSWPSAVG